MSDGFETLQLVNWDEVFAVNAENLESIDKKRLQAVWELFHSELIFLHKQLLVLRFISFNLLEIELEMSSKMCNCRGLFGSNCSLIRTN